jgi:hypothetical protein
VVIEVEHAPGGAIVAVRDSPRVAAVALELEDAAPVAA